MKKTRLSIIGTVLLLASCTIPGNTHYKSITSEDIQNQILNIKREQAKDDFGLKKNQAYTFKDEFAHSSCFESVDGKYISGSINNSIATISYNPKYHVYENKEWYYSKFEGKESEDYEYYLTCWIAKENNTTYYYELDSVRNVYSKSDINTLSDFDGRYGTPEQVIEKYAHDTFLSRHDIAGSNYLDRTVIENEMRNFNLVDAFEGQHPETDYWTYTEGDTGLQYYYVDTYKDTENDTGSYKTIQAIVDWKDGIFDEHFLLFDGKFYHKENDSFGIIYKKSAVELHESSNVKIPSLKNCTQVESI